VAIRCNHPSASWTAIVPEFVAHMPDLAFTALDDLAVLTIRGPDGRHFLQGQLSQDMDRLDAGATLLAGLHNPQGRCVTLMRLFHLDSEQLLGVLPASLATTVRTLLGKVVLRAKVKIEDANAQWRCYGLTGPDAEAAASTRVHAPLDANGFRQLVVAPRMESLPDGDRTTRDGWELDDIEAGLPEVLPATSGSFVAQMLNLDLLDAVSLTKGCYTGQEIIARAHYRGQVKRRMQRFFTASEIALAPGARIRLADGRGAQVVRAAPNEGGGQQFLAVTTLRAGNLEADPDSATEPGATHAEMFPTEDRRPLPAEQLPLPYALPDPA
jgi:folate-binding protein YgfZ